MAGPTNPDVGEMHIDASTVVVQAMPDEDMPKALKLRADADSAMEVAMVLTQEQIRQAGLNEEDMTRLRQLIEEHRRVTTFLKASRRMTDKLEQTLFWHNHEIAALFGEVASQGERRARTSPHRKAILDSLGPVLEYQTAPAKKAAATRAKNNGLAKAKGQRAAQQQGATPAAAAAPPAVAEVTASTPATEAATGT